MKLPVTLVALLTLSFGIVEAADTAPHSVADSPRQTAEHTPQAAPARTECGLLRGFAKDDLMV